MSRLVKLFSPLGLAILLAPLVSLAPFAAAGPHPEGVTAEDFDRVYGLCVEADLGLTLCDAIYTLRDAGEDAAARGGACSDVLSLLDVCAAELGDDPVCQDLRTLAGEGGCSPTAFEPMFGHDDDDDDGRGHGHYHHWDWDWDSDCDCDWDHHHHEWDCDDDDGYHDW